MINQSPELHCSTALFSDIRGVEKRCLDGALSSQVENALKIPPESSRTERSVQYPAGSSSSWECLLCVLLVPRISPFWNSTL